MEEEILSLIILGCKLARNLESHLPHLSTTTQPPNVLSNSCEEILRVFQSVLNRLMSLSTDHDHHHLHPHPSSTLSSMNIAINNIIPPDQVEPRPMLTELDASVQEWLKSSYTQAIETAAAAAQFSSISNDIVDVHHHHHHHHKNPFSSRMLSEQEQQQTSELGFKMPISIVSSNNIISTSAGGSVHHHQSAGHHHHESTTGEEAGSEYAGNNKTTTTTTTTTIPRTTPPVMVQRSRKRKDGADKRTVRVAGPRIGNMEIPPDDGFTWRKYGQKEILGSMFPRGYYRCTHKNFFGCEAKKQVQRLDLDPNTFEVTYYGIHTCQMGAMTPMGGGAGGHIGGPSCSSSSSQVLLLDDHDQYHSNMVVELVDAMFNTTTATSSTSGGGGGGGGTGINDISIDSIFLPSQAQDQDQAQTQTQAHKQQQQLQHHH